MNLRLLENISGYGFLLKSNDFYSKKGRSLQKLENAMYNVCETNGVFFSTTECALYFKKCNIVFVS